MSNGLSRLPDPYWLASVMSFVMLLPALDAAREVSSRAPIADNEPWRARHTVLLLVTAPLIVLSVAGMILPE